MIGFKIIDIIRGTKIVSIYKYLLHVQFSKKECLEEISRKSMTSLWNTAKNIPYYKDYKDYKDLPVLNKEIIRSNYDSFLNKGIQKSKWIKKKTGGSTGSPFVYYTSRESQSYLWAGILLAWNSAGWKPGDKTAFLAGSSLFGSSWKQKIYYKLMNVITFDSFDMSTLKMCSFLNKLNSSEIKFMYGYANSIYYLAKFNLDNKLNVRLRSVVTTAENLTSSMRETIERSFKCKVFNQYGCNDAGVSAFECEFQNGLHIINTRAYVEVVSGRLIATDTKNYVMPMMKYDSGDRVELSEDTCSCGRGFPLIKEIFGRSNDCVVNKKNGAVIHSEFFNHVFREDREISSFQIHLKKDTILINIITIISSSNHIKKNEIYKKIIQNKTGYNNVDIVFNQDLVKSENGKVKMIVNY